MADPMIELQALSSKRSNLRDKLKKRREQIGSILSQATAVATSGNVNASPPESATISSPPVKR